MSHPPALPGAEGRPDRSERDFFLMADDAELAKTSRFDFHKSSGNGGQKVNKTSSAVRIFHLATGITVAAAEFRSQKENRHSAFKKLRMAIAFQCRCPLEKDEEGRKRCPALLREQMSPPSPGNPRYPLWTASLFDCLAEADWDIGRCAQEILSVSRSALTKMLRSDPAVLRAFQERRNASAPQRKTD